MLYRDLHLFWPTPGEQVRDPNLDPGTTTDVTERSVQLLRTLTSANFPANTFLGTLTVDLSMSHTSPTWLFRGFTFADLPQLATKFDTRLSVLVCYVPEAAICPTLLDTFLSREVSGARAISLQAIPARASPALPIYEWDTSLFIKSADESSLCELHVCYMQTRAPPAQNYIAINGKRDLLHLLLSRYADRISYFGYELRSGCDHAAPQAILPKLRTMTQFQAYWHAGFVPTSLDLVGIWKVIGSLTEIVQVTFLARNAISPTALLNAVDFSSGTRIERLDFFWELQPLEVESVEEQSFPEEDIVYFCQSGSSWTSRPEWAAALETIRQHGVILTSVLRRRGPEKWANHTLAQ